MRFNYVMCAGGSCFCFDMLGCSVSYAWQIVPTSSTAANEVVEWDHVQRKERGGKLQLLNIHVVNSKSCVLYKQWCVEIKMSRKYALLSTVQCIVRVHAKFKFRSLMNFYYCKQHHKQH